MLSYEDKEFIRAYLRCVPLLNGSRVRATRAAIALRKLLMVAADSEKIPDDPGSLRRSLLSMHQQGKEFTPDEMRGIVEIFNLAVEVAKE